jgi:hypothetical protein
MKEKQKEKGLRESYSGTCSMFFLYLFVPSLICIFPVAMLLYIASSNTLELWHLVLVLGVSLLAFALFLLLVYKVSKNNTSF